MSTEGTGQYAEFVRKPDVITIGGHHYRPGTTGYLLAQEVMRLDATVKRVVDVCDRFDGYGHGVYCTHLEDQLPCSVCALLGDVRSALAESSTTPAKAAPTDRESDERQGGAA